MSPAQRPSPGGGRVNEPDPGVGLVRVPPLRTCVRDGQIVCVDDICRGSSRTICGLEEGIDFGVDDDDLYDWWDDDVDRWCQECGSVEHECHCDQPVFP